LETRLAIGASLSIRRFGGSLYIGVGVGFTLGVGVGELEV